jgi:[CysO sulfur-carrier protein]-S-L-cysteine hydrolase
MIEEDEDEAKDEVALTTIINKKHWSMLKNYSQKNKPIESCAILFGKRKNNQFTVTEIITMDNEDKSEIKFSINEEKLYRIYREAESVNLSVVGIYHTHPSKPIPSKTDIKFMKINPVPWIINSTITDETKCYIHHKNKDIREIELIVMD